MENKKCDYSCSCGWEGNESELFTIWKRKDKFVDKKVCPNCRSFENLQYNKRFDNPTADNEYTLAQIEAMIDVIKVNFEFWNGKIPEEIHIRTEYKTIDFLITVYQSRIINHSNSPDPTDAKEEEEVYKSEIRVTRQITAQELTNEVERLIDEQLDIYSNL